MSLFSFPASAGKVLYTVFLFLLFPLLFCVSAGGDLTRTEFTVQMKNFDPEFQDLKLVFFSDLHLRKETMAEGVFQELIQKVNEENADLIFIAGDIVDQTVKTCPEEFVHQVTAYLKNFQSRYGIFLCNGNHELAVNQKLLNAAFNTNGFPVLSDSFFFLTRNGKTLAFYGFQEPFYTEEEKRKKKKRDVNNPPLRITDNFLSQRRKNGSHTPLLLLSHRPEYFDLLPDEENILLLAGHHHGGIINLPFLPAGTLLSWYKKRKNPKFKGIKYVYGHYRKGNKQLFVTSGISGGDHSALRINVPREYAVITFTAKKDE